MEISCCLSGSGARQARWVADLQTQEPRPMPGSDSIAG